jgi:hypothetical protein
MLKGAREVRLDWPVSNAVIKPMRDAMMAANLTEPTQDMVLADSIRRQALTATSPDPGLDGRIRKIIGSVDESMDSSACCKQQCALGRSARPLGRAICAQHVHKPGADEPFPPRLPQPTLGSLSTRSAPSSAIRLVQVGCIGTATQLVPQEQ